MITTEQLKDVQLRADKLKQYLQIDEKRIQLEEEKSKADQDKVLKVLVEGPSKTNPNILTGRTESNKTVDLTGPIELIGQIVDVKITKAQTFSLYGEYNG